MTLFSRLAAYYPCDNTHGRSLSEDVVGTNDGTAGVVSAATGKVRQGMFFLASGSQFRSVPNDSAIQALKGCCCWVKFSTLAADQSIVSKGSDSTDANTSLKLWYDHSDTDLAFTVGDNSTSTTVRTDGLTLAVDTWYHIRCFNDGNRMGIAVNGTLYASGTARAPLTETGLLYLGRDFGGNYFDGNLDEVALFSTAPTVADGAALYNGGSGASLPLLDSLPGPSGRAGAVNRWLPPSYAESDDAVAYMAHGKLPVQRFDGTLAIAGVEAPDQKVTIKSSGAGSLTGKRYAYLRNLDAAGRVSSVSPLSDVHDTFGSLSGDVQAASNESPIVVTSNAHGLSTGDKIRVTGQLGNTAANGTWTITKSSANKFQLNGSVGNGDWSSSVGPGMRVTTIQTGAGGVNAVQSLEFSNTPTGGSFILYYKGEPTTSIAYNATAATIQTALRLLTTIGVEGVTCTGGPVNTTAVTITFSNELASQPVSKITVDYTGAEVTIAATVTQTGGTGQNEIQTLDLLNTPTGGTFTVTFDGQTTSNIAHNANAATVEAALEALSNITSGDLTTTGGALPGTAVTVEFGGTLAESNVAQMTINPTGLTGTGVSMAVSTPTPGVAGNDEWQYINPNTNGGTHEAHTVVGNASVSAGTFTLSGGSQGGNWTTAAIAYNATGMDILQAVWTAIDGLGGGAIGAREVQITAGGVNVLSDGDSVPFRYAGEWSQTDLTNITVNSSGLTGGTYSITNVADGAVAWTAITGTYTLTFDGQETVSLNFSDTISTVQSALESLSNIGSGNIEVLGGALSTYGMAFHFQGSLAATNVAEMSIDPLATSPASAGFSVLSMLDGGTGAATNEVQRITTTGTPSEGTFTLTYSGQTTSNLDYDATAAEVDAALESLSNIDSGDVTCTGGPLPGSVVDIEFTGNLAGTNVDEMTVDDNGLYRLTATTQPGHGTRNELVTLSPDVTPQVGTFTLTFGGETTSNLTYNASASTIQGNLEALSTIGSGNVACTGGPINSVDVVVEFRGTLAATDVGVITVANDMQQLVPSLLVTSTTTGSGGQNEVQVISVDGVTSGTYTLTYSAQTTAAIQFDATAAEVQDAIEALSTVGNGNVDVSGGPLTSGSLRVEFVGALGVQDLGPLTFSTNSLNNGGWTTGASEITYTDVDIPDSTNVTRRQILRTKPGAANVFYIDVDEEDVVSNTFSSTKTDDELLSADAVVMLDSNGVDTNLSRHGSPPNWKRSVASFQNRLFYGVDYVERSLVTLSGDTATGIATDWPNVFDDRTLYQDSGKAVAAVNADNQTAALTESTATAQTAAIATLRQVEPDSQRLYHSWVTASQSFPESVHPGQTFQVSRDTLDGEMTGQFSFDGRFYTAFEHSLYRYSFSSDPASFPDGDGQMQKATSRGMLNHQCVAFSDDYAYVLDRDGCYAFDGDTITPISEVIKPLFSGRSDLRIHWRNSDRFFVEYFAQQRTVRVFVTLDGGVYPRHAICHNVDQQYWWVEEYPWPVTSAARGVINGRDTVFLGSTSRRVFTLEGDRDGVTSSPATLRGTVTSAGDTGLTDSTATFDTSVVGLPIRIVDGTGYDQQRNVIAVSGTTLTVDRVWNVRPSTDSVYQIAGVHWSIRTGMLKYTQGNQDEVRRVELMWEPVSNAQQMEYRIFEDWASTAQTSELTLASAMTDGVETTAGSDRFEVDMTGRGHSELAIGGMRQEGVTGDEYVAIEVSGTTNGERHRLHGIAVSGAE